MIAFAWPHWLDWASWVWRNPDAYNFVSGPLPDITLLSGLFVLWSRHACHVSGCWRWGHPVPGTAHRACRTHHPTLQAGRVTEQHIRDAYEQRER